MFEGVGKNFGGLQVTFFYKFKSRKQRLSQVSLLHTTNFWWFVFSFTHLVNIATFIETDILI